MKVGLPIAPVEPSASTSLLRNTGFRDSYVKKKRAALGAAPKAAAPTPL